MSRPRTRSPAENSVLRSPTRAYQTDDASITDTLATTSGIRQPKRCPRRRSWTPLHPAHLTTRPTYQGVSPNPGGRGAGRSAGAAVCCVDRCPVGSGVAVVALVGGTAGTAVPRRSAGGRGDHLPLPMRTALARCPGRVRSVADAVEAAPPLQRRRHLGPRLGRAAGRGRRGRDRGLGGERGLHDHPRPPARCDAGAGHRGRDRTTRIC